MGKYIIDVPKNWVDITKGLHIPIEKVWNVGDLRIDTGLKLTPYTEPDRKAIDLQHAHDIENVAKMNYSKGAEDAWELARRIICPSDCCEDSISAHTKEIFNKEGWEIRSIFKDLSYQKAKTKYDKWKRENDKICVGDEVEYSYLGGTCRFVVLGIIGDRAYGFKYPCEYYDFDEYYDIAFLTKTGRHFDEVEELLRKFEET